MSVRIHDALGIMNIPQWRVCVCVCVYLFVYKDRFMSLRATYETAFSLSVCVLVLIISSRIFIWTLTVTINRMQGWICWQNQWESISGRERLCPGGLLGLISRSDAKLVEWRNEIKTWKKCKQAAGTLLFPLWVCCSSLLSFGVVSCYPAYDTS